MERQNAYAHPKAMEIEGDGGEEGVTVCGTLHAAPAGAEPTAVAVDTCEDVGASEVGLCQDFSKFDSKFRTGPASTKFREI